MFEHPCWVHVKCFGPHQFSRSYSRINLNTPYIWSRTIWVRKVMGFSDISRDTYGCAVPLAQHYIIPYIFAPHTYSVLGHSLALMVPLPAKHTSIYGLWPWTLVEGMPILQLIILVYSAIKAILDHPIHVHASLLGLCKVFWDTLPVLTVPLPFLIVSPLPQETWPQLWDMWLIGCWFCRMHNKHIRAMGIILEVYDAIIVERYITWIMLSYPYWNMPNNFLFPLAEEELSCPSSF
jgi:hypothetical protein